MNDPNSFCSCRSGRSGHDARHEGGCATGDKPMIDSRTEASFDLVLKGGRVIDERNGVDAVLDVAVSNDRIAAVAKDLRAAGARLRNVTGTIVAPGLIDIHAHVYHKATSLSVDPDMIARRSAITTLVDAGSAGAGNYDGFRDYVMA